MIKSIRIAHILQKYGYWIKYQQKEDDEVSPFYDDDSTENILREITQNLSRQVTEEIDSSDLPRKEEKTERASAAGRKKKLSTGKKIAIALASIVVLLAAGVFIAGNYFLDRINYVDKPKEDVPVTESTDLTDYDNDAIKPADANVINILLIGVEAIEDSGNGRSDSMMIATINQDEKAIKLASLMRDCYVEIPGHGQDRLNSAFSHGGADLLAATIEQNFDVHLDGCAEVDFEAFESIVDELGGVEIELTDKEASYLRSTNYISNPKYRTVTEGVNLMNGNQALGYARVRKVPGISGEHDDFARTNRQRIVLNAIFEKYKKQNLIQLVTTANNILPYITTNLTKTEILSYIAAVAGIGSMELETFRVPMDNAYTGAKINGQSVLSINFEKNNVALREFIYGVSGVVEEDDLGTQTASPENSAQ